MPANNEKAPTIEELEDTIQRLTAHVQELELELATKTPPPEPTPSPITTAEENQVVTLLRRSIEAHNQAWLIRRKKQPVEAKALLQKAYELRIEAQVLDPEHALPIWTTPVMEGPHKGIHVHDDLMAFYRKQLDLNG